ncbi:MAG: M1 family metallopeptidase [Pseudomonadales bacterium]
MPVSSPSLPAAVGPLLGLILLAALPGLAPADTLLVKQTKGTFIDSFRQLEDIWPTPNIYRTASGAPGHAYWQQQVDYRIEIALDEDARQLSGSETITYHNRSPDSLRYLWLQLDQNRFSEASMDDRTRTIAEPGKLTFGELRRLQFLRDFDGGHKITRVAAGSTPLAHAVVGTLLRVDLPEPLKPGASTKFSIDWHYNMVEEDAVNARAGYEHFPEDGNDIFLVAQWYPRLTAYSDYEGWHNKEFLGNGEFTLEFGNYDVSITVPADHIVSSTGVLQNAGQVLSSAQRARLKDAENASRPVYIVTPEEALENEKDRATGTRTWRFKADNVRDFAWASSRKFIWDAQGYQQNDRDTPFVMAMSFFPKEGDPLWSRYSTQAVIHTMEVYSRFSFPYPYPTAQSVNGPVGGMEYPMITFNGPRTELQEDGERTYSRGEKQFLIGVVIHEIGHTYFPMVVNSDERQWTWMDEGLNTFLQFIAEQEWEVDYPSERGEARWIVDFMKGDIQVPIMTNSESLLQFGNNAYAKPATALNILRETVIGRERFDVAFREYAQRWMFRRPTPVDLFRTIEESSGTDLDWFWRGWFYSTDHVDISIDRVTHLKVNTKNPDVEYPWLREQYLDEPVSRTDLNNAAEGKPKRTERMPELLDFYNENDPFTVSNKDRNAYAEYLKSLEDPKNSTPDWKKRVLEKAIADDLNYYMLEFSNRGGLVMPIILRLHYQDGSAEDLHLPAEIWRRNAAQVNKLIARSGVLTGVEVDPHWETADVDQSNNHYPRRILPSRLELFDMPDAPTPIPERDLMQDIKTELKLDGSKTDGPDAAPLRKGSADEAVPMLKSPPSG